MANILDLRRFDLRTNVLENPFWITSAEITAACDAKVAGLFSFPISAIANTLCEAFYGNTKIIIQEAVLEINTAFSGGTPALIMGTHVLDLQTTLAYTDSLDPNAFVEAIDGSGVTNSAGLYPLHATSAFNTARVAGQHAAGYVITPANTAVPCVTVGLSGTVTAGSAYLHLLIAVVPVVS